MRSKKAFSVGEMLPIAILLVVTTIGISIGADIVNNVYDDQAAEDAGCDTTSLNCSYSANVSRQGLEGMETFGDYLPTIALVVVAAIIIGVLVTYLARQ